MSPYEKAESLIEKYTAFSEYDYKECALIAVQECIDATRGRWGDMLSMQYWLDVEKEIKEY